MDMFMHQDLIKMVLLGEMGRDHAAGELEIGGVVARTALGVARTLHRQHIGNERGLVKVDRGALVLGVWLVERRR